MTATGFVRALPRVLQHEGGYVNDPHDPGGKTNFGVTFRVYDAYRTRKGLPTRDVHAITSEEVADIYRRQYWDAVHGDELPPGVDYVLFDGAVNSGPSQSIKWLQRALGITVDGQMGQATLQAVNEHSHPVALVDEICNRRMAFLQALKTWPRFGKGWASRVAGVRKVGKAWALGVGAIQMETDHPPVATPKAPVRDAKNLPGKGTADATTGGGIVTGGLGGVLETIRQQLEPFTEAVPWAGKVVAGLIVVGALLTIAGLAYRWYAARKSRALADALDLPQGVAG